MNEMRFSPAAMGAGAINSITLDIAQSEINEQKAKQNAQQMNADVAKYSSNAIGQSGRDQAQATRCDAYGSIAAGFTQAGAEVAGTLNEAYRSTDGVQKADGIKAKNVENWQEAVKEKETPKAEVIGKVGETPEEAAAKAAAKTPPTKEQVTDAIARLKEVDVTTANPNDYKADIETVKAATDVEAKDDCLTKLDKRMNRAQKKLEGSIDGFRNKTQRTRENLRTYGRITGDLAHGFSKAEQAKAQLAQSEQDAIKAAAQFGLDSAKAGVDAADKDLANKKSVRDSTIQLVSELNQANRV